MAFPRDPLAVRVEILVDGQWTDITGDVYTREDITISRGRRDEGSAVDPGRCSFVLNNRDGKYSPRNPRSPYFRRIGRNTPVRVSVVHGGKVIPRFFGEISSWPPRWDLSGADVFVPVEAAGILRRLGAGAAPLQSALQRFYMSRSPLAYWPLTDGPDSWTGASVAGNGGWITRVFSEGGNQRPQWAEYDLASWMEPVSRIPAAERGRLRGTVRRTTSTSWTVEFIRGGMGGFDSFAVELDNAGHSTDAWWHFGFDHTQQSLYLSYAELGANSSSTGIVVRDFSVPDAFTADPHLYRLTVNASGSSSAYQMWMDGVMLRSGTYNVPPRRVRALSYEWWTPDDGTAEAAGLGHVVLWDTSSAPLPAESLDAFRGHEGEAAGRRIERVCAEAGIPFAAVGDLDNTQPVGPQELTAPLENISSAVLVDGGILYEARDSATLVYRTNRSRYNGGRELEV